MTANPVCPRCLAPVRAPGLWTSSWQCDEHGNVLPYRAVGAVTARSLEAFVAEAAAPVWIPRPLPVGWVVSGLAGAGDSRTGPRATALACTGPSPLGGPGDLVLVAEEPGVGLGARLAGLTGPDPDCPTGPPETKVEADGHVTALWPVPGTPADRVAFVGEALGIWLWMVLWPEPAGMLLLEHLRLEDLRSAGVGVPEPLFGAASPYLGPDLGWPAAAAPR